MKSLFNFLVAFLIIGLSIFSSISHIIQQQTITNAQSLSSQFVDRIESSYYDENVINECKQKATENDMILEVRDVTIYDDRKDVEVKLKYNARNFLFGTSVSGEIIGYAR